MPDPFTLRQIGVIAADFSSDRWYDDVEVYLLDLLAHGKTTYAALYQDLRQEMYASELAGLIVTFPRDDRTDESLKSVMSRCAPSNHELIVSAAICAIGMFQTLEVGRRGAIKATTYGQEGPRRRRSLGRLWPSWARWPRK